MNQVDGFFSILTRRSVRRTSFPSIAALRRHINEVLAGWNDERTLFVWTKSAHRILRNHNRMLARISRAEYSLATAATLTDQSLQPEQNNQPAQHF